MENINIQMLMKELEETKSKLSEMDKMNKHLKENFQQSIEDNQRMNTFIDNLKNTLALKEKESISLKKENNELKIINEEKLNELLEINDKYYEVEDKVTDLENDMETIKLKVIDLEKDNKKLSNYIHIRNQEGVIEEFVEEEIKDNMEYIRVVRNDEFFKDYPELENLTLNQFVKSYCNGKPLFDIKAEKISILYKSDGELSEVYSVLYFDNETLLIPDYDSKHPELNVKVANKIVDMIKDKKTVSSGLFLDEARMYQEEDSVLDHIENTDGDIYLDEDEDNNQDNYIRYQSKRAESEYEEEDSNYGKSKEEVSKASSIYQLKRGFYFNR